jgi:hypothetical protein
MEAEKEQIFQQTVVKKPQSIERIEAHLNKLHDFVRSLDLRIESLEFESEKKQAIAKAVAAKIGKVKTQWQESQELGQLPDQEQGAAPKERLRAGQRCLGGKR